MPFMLVGSAAHSCQPQSTPELEPSASKGHLQKVYKLLYIIIVLIFIVLLFQCTFFAIIITIV